MDADEREIVADVIGSVRTLARQVLTLHLQLGAVRTVLVENGITTETELEAAFAKLQAVSSADEVLDREVPTVDQVFEDMLRRLGGAA